MLCPLAEVERLSSLRGDFRMRVCITGGLGFLGSNLADALLNDGHYVDILDNCSRAGVENNRDWLLKNHGASQLYIDSKSTVEEAKNHYFHNYIKDCNAIFHFAANTSAIKAVEDPRYDFEVNTLGGFNVLEAARAGGKKPLVVFASSNKVYGTMNRWRTWIEFEKRWETGILGGVDERLPLDPCTPYGCSKAATEMYMKEYYRCYDIPTCVFRYGCLYGERQHGMEAHGWMAYMMQCAKEHNKITLFGDGKQVRDVLYVSDAIDLCKEVLENPSKVAGQVFNVGGGPDNTISLLELVDKIGELKGRIVPVEHKEARPQDQRWFVNDIRKVKEVTGWYPKVDVNEGVKKLWDWVNK